MNEPLRPLQVAYFFHLHLDTCAKFRPHPNPSKAADQHYVCEVEAKPRPMLVWDVEPEKERGCQWYRLLRFTTKGRDAKGEVPSHLTAVGKLLDGKETYIDSRPSWYPATMVVSDPELQRAHKSIDRLTLGNVVKILRHKMMRA